MILIRKGMNGIVVGNVQQALIEAGYNIPQIELGTLTFGDNTYDAVRAFQASHLDSEGRPLTEDGIVGEETLWALQHPGGDAQNFFAPGWFYNTDAVRVDLQVVLSAACGEIGAYEEPDGSNDGPMVRRYTEPGFLGDPWCALFASWAFAHLQQGSPFGREAATWGLFDWAMDNDRVVGNSDAVRPGDILLILRGSRNDPKRRGHTMMVCGILDDGRICTVEGNASNAVRGLVRDRTAISAIIRPCP